MVCTHNLLHPYYEPLLWFMIQIFIPMYLCTLYNYSSYVGIEYTNAAKALVIKTFLIMIYLMAYCVKNAHCIILYINYVHCIHTLYKLPMVKSLLPIFVGQKTFKLEFDDCSNIVVVASRVCSLLLLLQITQLWK